MPLFSIPNFMVNTQYIFRWEKFCHAEIRHIYLALKQITINFFFSFAVFFYSSAFKTKWFTHVNLKGFGLRQWHSTESQSKGQIHKMIEINYTYKSYLMRSKCSNFKCYFVNSIYTQSQIIANAWQWWLKSVYFADKSVEYFGTAYNLNPSPHPMNGWCFCQNFLNQITNLYK